MTTEPVCGCSAVIDDPAIARNSEKAFGIPLCRTHYIAAPALASDHPLIIEMFEASQDRKRGVPPAPWDRGDAKPSDLIGVEYELRKAPPLTQERVRRILIAGGADLERLPPD